MQRCRHPDGHPGSGPGVRRLSASAETTLLSPEQRAGMAFRLAARPPGPAQRHEQCLARVHKCRAMRHFHGAGRIRARPQEERPLPAYAYSSLPLARYRRCPQGRRGAGVRPHVHAPTRLPAPGATIRISGDLGPPSRSSTHLHTCLAQAVGNQPLPDNIRRLPHRAAGITYTPINTRTRMSLPRGFVGTGIRQADNARSSATLH